MVLLGLFLCFTQVIGYIYIYIYIMLCKTKCEKI